MLGGNAALRSGTTQGLTLAKCHPSKLVWPSACADSVSCSSAEHQRIKRAVPMQHARTCVNVLETDTVEETAIAGITHSRPPGVLHGKGGVAGCGGGLLPGDE